MIKNFILFFYILLISPYAFSITNNDIITKNSLSCPRCNIIIISLTGLRNKNMNIYGYGRNTTPNINHFFNDSYIFTNAFAPASFTFTDSISLFYSISPQIHKSFNRYSYKWLDKTLKNYPSFPEILARDGYKTAAFVSDEDYFYNQGVGRTFQYYFDRSLYPDFGITFKPFTYSVGTSQLVPIVNKWLNIHKKEKFLLFMQAYDMHCPYSPLDKFANLYPGPHSKKIPFTSECLMTLKDVIKNKKKDKILLQTLSAFMDSRKVDYYLDRNDQKYLESRYDAELNQTDSNLKALFETIKELKLDKNTIIILLSEHGDNLGENGFYMKMSPTAKGNLQRNNLGFPLIVKTPSLNGKHKQDQIIQTIDLAPTLLEMVGLKPDLKMQGKSFMDIVGTKKEINDYAYSFSIVFDFLKLGLQVKTMNKLESLIGKDWKLDHSIQIEISKMRPIKEEYFLYNLNNDPNESMDLSLKNKKKLKEMQQILSIKRIYYSTTNHLNKP
ncbi:MAG: sulfatase-like hydrolase/transferase [Bacteriovorax sp.]|nr:sulfatase-like hydrolase/transferase [Bacteriovorax sp.]